jgi:hypothetical protein
MFLQSYDIFNENELKFETFLPISQNLENGAYIATDVVFMPIE